MGITVTGKLNKPANQFQAGESVGFGVGIGVQYYDRASKTKEWTNYKAVLFAKAPGQIQFLQNNLVEGAIIEVSGDRQKIDVYEGQNGSMYSIEILDAKIGYVSSGVGNAIQAPQQQQYAQNQQYAPAPAQSGAAQHQQNAPAQNVAASHSNQGAGFDDDIPY